MGGVCTSTSTWASLVGRIYYTLQVVFSFFVVFFQDFVIDLVWMVDRSTIMGNEANFTSHISVRTSNDTDNGNNNAMTVIAFGSLADLKFTNL